MINDSTNVHELDANQLADVIRRRGYAVVIFGPGDMEGYGDPETSLEDRLTEIAGDLEDRLVEVAWDVLTGMLGTNDKET